MTFTQFTFKNLFRRRVRTLLTVLGVGLGIGAVVALLGMAWGMQAGWTEALHARKTDLAVRKASGGLAAQSFDQSVAEKVKSVDGVLRTAGMLGEVMSVEEVSLMVVSGREWGSFVWESLKVVEGRLPNSAEEQAVVLGTIAAETLGKKVGDKVTIEIEEFTVVGIVDGQALVENGSIVISLPLLQKTLSKTGLVNFINIQVKPEVTDLKAEAEKIGEQLPGLRVDLAQDVFNQNESMKTFEAMNWGTSAIAMIVGAFGVMNTMFMSVFERTREIGILIALGWRRSRILRLILWESTALCFTAGLFGIVFGIVLLKTLALTPWMHGRLEPVVSWNLCGIALAIAIGVGVASGLYPAYYCTKINPSLAIREG
jgi:putative ABC transport system permease protein